MVEGCRASKRGGFREPRILGVSSPNPGDSHWIPGDSPRAPFPRPFRPQESGRFGRGFPGVAHRIPGDSPRAPFQRPFRPQESGRFGRGFTGVAHRIPGDSPRAPFPRPFRPQESGRFGRGFPGVAHRIPGDSPRAPFPRPFRPQESGRSIGVVLGCTSDSRGFISESRGFSLDSRGFSPGSVPAAFQAAGEWAIDWRSSGVAPRIHAVSSPNPGDSPRAPFPRPFRPPSVRGGFGFPGILSELRSRGHSGRRKAGERLSWSWGAPRIHGVSSPNPGDSHWIPGDSPRAPFQRPFRPPSVRGGFDGVASRNRGVSSPYPGDSPRAPFPRPFRPQQSGRFRGEFVGVASRNRGVSSPNPGDSHWSPGDSPRAPFQRPFRPPSVRGGFGFPGILTGLRSRGLSGRRRAQEELRPPGTEGGAWWRCRFGPCRG